MIETGDPEQTHTDEGGEEAAQLLAWERRARSLLQSVAIAANEAFTIEEAMQSALDHVCSHAGWTAGNVRFLAGEKGRQRPSSLWHLESSRRPDALRTAMGPHAAPGVGLPGRVLESGKPAWTLDLATDPRFAGMDPVSLGGLRAAFAFPVLVSAKSFAVFEFFSAADVAPDPPLLEAMETIGTLLGQVVERKWVDDALRESERRLRSVAQSANDAIISADNHGKIISWNRGAQTMFGYTEEEVMGMPLTLLIPERYRAAHQLGLARMRATGVPRIIGKTVEVHGNRRDGSEFPLELSLATWKIGDDTFYSGIIRDITERKVAEETLRAFAAKLEISEREALEAKEEAFRSERRAREANRAKSTFLANMSHELRTPLNAIIGFIQLMDRDRGLSAEQRENLGIIMRSGEHLLGMINDVLSLAKIEAGQLNIIEEIFDLHRLLQGLEEMFRIRSETKGLRLAFDSTGLPQYVSGDDGKLRQVLINLLGNAVKFTEFGSVMLRARWEEGLATFEIEDTGPGIAAGDLEKLFEPFIQTTHGAKSREGTGLGLAISRNFVRLLGGEIWVTSEVGKGTNFTLQIRLPLVTGMESDQKHGRVIRLAPGQAPCRILVVDDARENRILLYKMLTMVGFEVREAANGREAVDGWAAWHPHLIFMDVRMPVMDGIVATKQIRSGEREVTGEIMKETSPAERRSVIVALTASVFEHERETVLAAGCDDFVMKPFREATIFDKLSEHLGVHFLHEETIPPPPAVLTQSDAPVLTAERLKALPTKWVEDLTHALTIGDDKAAHRAVDQIGEQDQVLAYELRRMVKGLQFDELLDWIERIPA
jgi:two-component system, sensor histidine kinase and response regulator